MAIESPRIERRRARTAAAIVDAAESLLIEVGPRAATVDAIAERADIAIATLYSHFDGKDDVLRALAARTIERNAESLDAALAEQGSAVERLEAVARSYLDFHLANPSALRVLALAPAEVDAALDELVRRVAGVFEEGARSGELRSDIEPLRIARFAWGAWNSSIALHARGVLSRAELQRTLDDGLTVLIAGLTNERKP